MHRTRFDSDYANVVITRSEFIGLFGQILNDYSLSTEHPIWIPEHDLQTPCTHFVCIGKIIYQFDDYWLWCTNTLNGHVRCFSESANEQWWGFTNKTDIPLWLLKWT